MAIKVLRIIEYTYRDAEVMASDMLRWTTAHNNGAMQMRSASLQPETLDWAPDNVDS